ncbi:MAG: tRNA lysidine(34) synthetase TilS [Pseudomonadota bacterium]
MWTKRSVHKSKSSRSLTPAKERRHLSNTPGTLTFDWPLPPGEAAAIAVSGGADSFALLHWAWQAGHPVVALTVDHGLREESAAEAGVVQAFCSERNIPHETLVWEGEKPETGIQAAARDARYRLLCQACERLGLEHLIAAHTADDQAETVFMRLRRGSGRGLAGMPRRRKIAAGPGELITLHRPLLEVRRGALRAYAEEHELPFVDDPSNDDDKYERVRVRALLAALEQQDLLTVEALCGVASERAFTDQSWRLSSNGQHFSYQYAQSDGAYLLPRTVEWDELRPVRFVEIASVVNAIGGGRKSPRELSLHLDLELPEQLAGVTLAELGVDAAVVAYREPAALLARADGTPGFTPIPVEPGTKHLYDRRFIVEIPEDIAPETVLRPLGQLIPRDIVRSTVARQRIATLPCLAFGDQVTHLPEQAVEAVTKALQGWKRCECFLPTPGAVFKARSLLAERFAGDVIRF